MNTTPYTKNNHIQAKNTQKYYRFKMAAKRPIFCSRHFDFGENLKKTNKQKQKQKTKPE